MVWNSVAPDGTQSVKANESIQQDNTTYTKTEMNKDHYWDTSANQDGHHTKVEMDKQSSDPAISAGMNGVFYVKDTALSPRSEGFYRNSAGIYQFIPSFKTGTHLVTAVFTNMITVPNNTYGEIVMFLTGSNGSKTYQAGGFRASNSICESWSFGQRNKGTPGSLINLTFANGADASGLNIRVIKQEASSGSTWQYRVTYRDQ